MSPSSPPRSSDNHDDNDNHDDTKDIHFVGSEHAPTSTSSSTNSSPSESNFTPVQRPGFIDAMISEDPVFPDAPVHADEDRRTVRRPSPSMDGKLKLSTTSGLYDRERKGYLDATEQAMRRMDSQNRGFLDNEKVYKIMESLQTEQKKSAQLIESLQREHQKTMSLKRGILYMALFAVLLALSNIGTGFAASRLAKDIIVTGGSTDLVTKNGKTRVATTMKNVVLEFNPILAPTDPTSRRLHERMLQNATTMACGSETMANVNGTNLSTITCEAVGHITYADAVQLYQQFCPEYPFAAGVTSPDGLCSNWGLAEVLLKCGSRFTRVLGGNYFPTAGVPAMDGSYFVFPTPTVSSATDISKMYFAGRQLLDQPLPAYSLTANPPPITCEEDIYFKLYCSPNTDQGCFLISTYWNSQRLCLGQVQMCAATTSTNTASRRQLRAGSSDA